MVLYGRSGWDGFNAEARAALPPFRILFLTAGALCAALLSGCTGAGINLASGLEGNANFAGQSDLILPDQVAVLPSSFAGPSPSADNPQVASLQTEKPAMQSFEVASLPQAEVNGGDRPTNIVHARPGTQRGEVDRLIAKYAAIYEVPEQLVRRVVKRESNFNPAARNRIYWGLMQIRHDTARGMGYRGSASGLLDAETNLKYAVKYLRGAWMVSGGNHDRAVGFYARGYYYDAKRKGLLDETGLGRDRVRRRA